MIIYGEGGTGKSKVIQSVTRCFEDLNVRQWLIKCAYTGVAASVMNGKTTHTVGNISQGREKAQVSDKAKAKLQTAWKERRYMILDEYSMISKPFLQILSQNITIGVDGRAHSSADASFGAINVILCGDLHQFPLVAVGKRQALFYQNNPSADTIQNQIGREIYEEFTTVVVLNEQMRVTDTVWRGLLGRLRSGTVEDCDIDMLSGLVIGSQKSPATNFSESPWAEAALVTPRHSVRTQWNSAVLRKHCRTTGNQLFICKAEDRVGNRALTLRKRYTLAKSSMKRDSKRYRELPDEIKLACGMKVMVTMNVETDLDVTNGARGEIVDIILIILASDEPTVGDDAIVQLHFMPAYILVRLSCTQSSTLDGLASGVIPVEPMESR